MSTSNSLSLWERAGVRALLSLLLLSAVALLLGPTPAATQPIQTIIGVSQRGQPLVVHHIGAGATSILVMGGQHGGPEANTVRLSHQVLAYFAENPQLVPSHVRLDIIPEANPDGLRSGSRQFASGVDPNRNWDGPGWSPDAADSNGVFRQGLGGTEPFSEPETQATRDYVLSTRPILVVNYHSRGGFLLGGRSGPGAELADVYAAASGYHRPIPGAGAGSVLGYRATGSMNVWLNTEGITGMLIELSDSVNTEFARNLGGLLAALSLLGA